jgi:hypothetical protein
MKGEFATILLLFLAIIGFSLWISYKESTITTFNLLNNSKRPLLSYSAHEPFSTISYSDANSHSAVNDVDVQLVVKNATQPPSKCADLGGSWEGNGLNCSPNATQWIDIFSQASGSVDCGDKSSGYHNSKGGLCMTDDMLTLLRTRGGNATN